MDNCDYLRLYCERVKALGGRVRLYPNIPEAYRSPFDRTMGLDYFKKEIWVSWSPGIDMMGLIHEAGHAFASKVPPNEVESDFVFLGWEQAFAKEMGLYDDWFHNLQSYWIPWQVLHEVTPWAYSGQGDTEYGDLDDRAQEAILAYLEATAIASGLVVDGRAVSIREVSAAGSEL